MAANRVKADLAATAQDWYSPRPFRPRGERRRAAARELGISERTLYRKIKNYGFEELDN